MKLKHWTLLWAILLLLLLPTICWAELKQAVTFGADLTEQQKTAMIRTFGINADTAGGLNEQVVTNSEERAYLKGLVPDNVIGSKAISSAYVQLLPVGTGISAETYNITWVTGEMYTNALVTAGVKDAKVIAAAPFAVSGTAALTGVFKAFEAITGNKLSEERKKAANEELIRTGELGQELQNKEQATKLIVLVKDKVLADKLNTPEEIKTVVINIAAQLNINLTQEQINRIVNLMLRIKETPVTVKEFRDQVSGIQQKLDVILQKQEEARGFFSQIWASLQEFFRRIAALFKLDFGKDK